MRPRPARTAQAPAAAAPAPAPGAAPASDAAPAPAPAPRAPRALAPAPPEAAPPARDLDGLGGVRALRQRLSFSVSLGYQIDGARATGRNSLAGRPAIVGRDYAELRNYGFGEAFVSTRGLGAASLATYFAARFQAARRLDVDADALGDTPPPDDRTLAPPITTWFERSGTELRTGWGEVRDFLPRRFGLAALRVRAGDQFVYGPWVVHLRGLYAAYEGRTLTLSGYGGQRRADYQRELADYQPAIAGASAKLDVRGLVPELPLALAAELLRVGASAEVGQPGSSSAQLQVDWRPRADIAVIGQQRWLDGDVASQHLEVRTRYRDVTNVVFEVSRRLADDWRWDPTFVRPAATPTEPRRYLELGPVVPQLLVSARGGTLIAENLDLFARIAAAPDTGDANSPSQTFAASYLELAGALEARVRRQVAIGASALSRDTRREDRDPIPDTAEAADPLPPSGRQGDEGFIELGGTARLTLGARRLSALIEVYGRWTRFPPVYGEVGDLPSRDARQGGRFTIDAWIGKQLRLFATYEVSSAVDAAPEISGYRSLRVVASGVY
jgi:hypothetical protein